MESDQLTVKQPPLVADTTTSPSQTDLLVQRLFMKGVPMPHLETKERGVMLSLKENKMMLQEVVSALLPGVEEAQLTFSDNAMGEGIRWIQWLMFEGDPDVKLAEIRQQAGHARGVCGAVWGANDIAYRCRTCENDPTCAICVPCFQAGDHSNHDYSMIHTGGGCCDCGDNTAWKESGFCSQHRGPGQVPHLSDALVYTIKPVLEAVFIEWARRLQAAERVTQRKVKQWDDQAVEEKVASQTSAVIVQMLLNFCNCSESMLTFTGGLMGSCNVGLLDNLLRSECFLPKELVAKLHELLFKLMGDPNFKYQFAKVFIVQFPHLIRDAMNEDSESAGPVDSPTLSSFSVQLFTVPTLTPRLVVELRLLDMLLETLKDVLLPCAGDDGRLLINKGLLARNHCYHILGNIRFVMRHLEVARYVAQERPDLSKAWLHFLAYTQGMDPQRRQSSIHVEEETENWISAYFLESQMADIHPLYIDGAAKMDHVAWVEDKFSSQNDISCSEELEDEGLIGRHAKKIGRISRESDHIENVGMSGRASGMDEGIAGGMVYQGSCQPVINFVAAAQKNYSLITEIPAALLWLISECTKVLDVWLLLDASRERAKSKWPSVQKGGGVVHRRGHWRGRGESGITRDSYGLTLAESSSGGLGAGASTLHGDPIRESPIYNRQIAAAGQHIINGPVGRRETGMLSQSDVDLPEVDGNSSLFWTERALSGAQDDGMDGKNGSAYWWWMGSELPDPSASLNWSDRKWLEIDFDVSQQDVSFHIPLHRFLALALQRSMEICATSPKINQQEASRKSWHSDEQSIGSEGNLLQIFPAGYQVSSFASFLMEHPLRLQVFCAQVGAGIWRRNGHSVQALCDHYHSVKWCEESSDLDLFLLQCCGAMSPPEEFVARVVSRFGLAYYFSLFLLRPNEYETTLAQHMLSFLVRLISERSFCGLSAAQSSRRDLVRRLAISDATHSQLMKSLPRRLLENKQNQEILLSISTFRKPSGMQQGRYSLRKECWQELDLYHPLWNARELQSAEERYLHACKSSAMIEQLPRWQNPFPSLQSLSRIATCGRVHDILRSVFFHAAFSENMSESRAPEAVLITALHLLALGLDVCSLFAYKQDMNSDLTVMQGNSGTSFSAVSPADDAQEPPPLLAKATDMVYVGAADRSEISSRHSLLSLLVMLMQKHGTAEHQSQIGNLIKRLLEKFAELHRGCMYAIESLAPEILHRVSTGSDAKRSKVLPNVSEAENSKMLARERQAAIMAKMKAAQEKFVATLQPSHESNGVNKDTLFEKIRSSGKYIVGRKIKALSLSNEHSHQDSMTMFCCLCRDFGSDIPTSFLTFIQRSRLLAIVEKGIPSWDRGPKELKVQDLSLDKKVVPGAVSGDTEAHESQIRIELLNLIHMALSGEIDQEGPLEVEALLELLRQEHPVHIDTTINRQFGVAGNMGVRMSESPSSEIGSDAVEEELKCSSSDSANIFLSDFERGSDTMDQNETDKTRENAIITVLLEYASILSRNHREQESLENESSISLAGPQRQRFSRLYPTSTLQELFPDKIFSHDSIGVHISSCGHSVHQECLDRYLSSLLQRNHNRTLFEGLQIVDPNQGEFLCPVCRRLANSVLPFVEESTVYSDQKGQATACVSMSHSCSEESVSNSSCQPSQASKALQVPHAMHMLQHAEELVWKSGFRKALSKPLPKALKQGFDSLFSRLCGVYFPERVNSRKSDNCRVSQSLLLWDVLRYTIMSTELAARPRKDAVCSTTDGLTKSAESFKGSILPLLLCAAKATLNQNRQSVLLRARGMQLLVGSICYGVSKDSVSEQSMSDGISKLLQFIDKDQEAADLHFWRRTADPLLAHDPFSSLMWLLFCLPLTFPSSAEPFIWLVHLLYLVCVTQAVAFMGNFLLQDSQLSSSAQGFVQDVVVNLTGIPVFRGLDEDNPTIPSGPLLIVLRRSTLTYLRRCALLQNLISGVANNEPVGEEIKGVQIVTDGDVTTGNLVDRIGTESIQAIPNAFVDLKELEYLEQKFCLPPLQTILEEESNREIVLRWCQHLTNKSGSRKSLPIYRPVTAAPFKLMELPTLYQTLLQRYIKECCPFCSTVPEQPALCLLCGTLCCAVNCRLCCSINRPGECYRHAMICGGGVAVFLMIRKTNILLQRCARQASWPSPYLDAFGEEDIDMYRGKPLYLNEERYKALTEMVASHGLDRNSIVLSHTARETIIWADVN